MDVVFASHLVTGSSPKGDAKPQLLGVALNYANMCKDYSEIRLQNSAPNSDQFNYCVEKLTEGILMILIAKYIILIVLRKNIDSGGLARVVSRWHSVEM